MKAGRLALRGQLGGDLSEFAQKPWESCVLMSIKSDRPARDTPMSPDLLGREHHRNELVSPATPKSGSLGLEICSSGNGRIEGVR
jgi:hypothetical protein